MPITSHPPRGSIVTVDYSRGFKEPEMVKVRLAIVVSPDIKNRIKLATVVPLSLTEPEITMPYHKLLPAPFEMGKWGNHDRWIKGDMLNSIGFHRIDFLRLGKDMHGKRVYQLRTLSDDDFKTVKRCVLHGIGLSSLTKRL